MRMGDVLLFQWLQSSPSPPIYPDHPAIHPSTGAAPGGSHRPERKRTRSCIAGGWMRCNPAPPRMRTPRRTALRRPAVLWRPPRANRRCGAVLLPCHQVGSGSDLG